jgi:hypothetical protein
LGDAALNLGHLADLLFQCHSRKKVFDPSLNGCVGVSVNAIHARLATSLITITLVGVGGANRHYQLTVLTVKYFIKVL